MRRLLPAMLLAAVLLLCLPTAASARPHYLNTGFTDDAVFLRAGHTDRLAGFSHVRAARGSVVRAFIAWSDVAPSPPPSRALARDPGWGGYRWDTLDRLAREATAARLRLLVTVGSAPAWAEGPGRRRSAPAGSWRPSAPAFRDFAEAAARRYSGSFAGLPRIRYWQGFNEANLSNFLNPQWTRRRGRLVPASPGIYRRLLNGFYAGIKAGRRGDLVVTAGTAPFGDHRRGGRRMDAAYFVRNLFCLRGRRRPRPIRRCGPVRFDALAHHPYPIGPPTRTAAAPDDVVVPDIWKLTGPLRVALRSGKVRPRRHKQIWATEISWDTRPPDPDGIGLRRQASYLQGAFYTLWRQGVDVVTWFLMRDEAPQPSYGATLQSGVYFRGPTVAQDRRKPFSFQAFRFPFTAYRRRGVAQIWGLAPHPGTVAIETRRRGRWRHAFRVRTRRGRLFLRPRRIRKGTVLRARQGSETSLAWRVSQNATENRR